MKSSCTCRGQCGRHAGLCGEIFGQLDLFGGPQVEAVIVRAGKPDQRAVCQECASSWLARQRERRVTYTEPADRLNEASRRMIQNW